MFRNCVQSLNTHTLSHPCLTLPDFQNLPERRSYMSKTSPGGGIGMFTGRIRVIKTPNFDAYVGLHLWWTPTASKPQTTITHTSLKSQRVVIFIFSPVSFFLSSFPLLQWSLTAEQLYTHFQSITVFSTYGFKAVLMKFAVMSII